MHSGGSGDFRVSVHIDNGMVPGAPVAGGRDLFVAGPGGIGEMLTAGSTVTLAPNTTYWFVASADQALGATRYWWNLTDSATIHEGVPEFGMPLTSANNAAGWAAYPGSSLQMEVYGAVVPEPATFSLFGMGGIGVWVLRNRRRNTMRRKKPVPRFEELRRTGSFMDDEGLTKGV